MSHFSSGRRRRRRKKNKLENFPIYLSVEKAFVKPLPTVLVINAGLWHHIARWRVNGTPPPELWFPSAFKKLMWDLSSIFVDGILWLETSLDMGI